MAGAEEECIHGLGQTSACVLCNGRATREAKEGKDVDYMFPAKMISLLGCGHFPRIGDIIVRRKDGKLTCDTDECIQS